MNLYGGGGTVSQESPRPPGLEFQGGPRDSMAGPVLGSEHVLCSLPFPLTMR